MQEAWVQGWRTICPAKKEHIEILQQKGPYPLSKITTSPFPFLYNLYWHFLASDLRNSAASSKHCKEEKNRTVEGMISPWIGIIDRPSRLWTRQPLKTPWSRSIEQSWTVHHSLAPHWRRRRIRSAPLHFPTFLRIHSSCSPSAAPLHFSTKPIVWISWILRLFPPNHSSFSHFRALSVLSSSPSSIHILDRSLSPIINERNLYCYSKEMKEGTSDLLQSL